MSGSKHFDKIAWIVTALMLAVTILFMNGGALGLKVMAHTMGYENRLFDNTSVHTIDIVMNDWNEFIANATSEEYYAANVVIDGEAYKNVGIRGKGNTSLSTVSSLGSERYSFKIEFDQYDSSVSYHGLDKLSLNNLIQDSTMMKDYLTYTMMNELGAAAPLCSFVYITVNGEDWGLYLAVEGVEDSFLERNYGSDYGDLYKPDSMSFGGGRGNGKDFDMNDFMGNTDASGNSDQNTATPQMPDMGNMDPSQTQGGFGGAMNNAGDAGFSQMPGGMAQGDFGNGDNSTVGGRGDFSFRVDEETLRAAFEKLEIDLSLLDGVDFENITTETFRSLLSSLDEKTIQALMQEIMGNVSFDRDGFGGDGMGGMGMGSSDVKLQYVDDNIDSYSNIWNNAKTDITEADQTRLIESLEKLSNGEQIESVVDIEQVIRYFVVHNYVCNGDSYTGSMIHNYYLYEENGQLAMIPWDYNLAFGTFQGSNAQSTVNTPIDSPIDGGSAEDRPMWNWIISNENYTELYHQYFAEFLNTVDINGIIDNAYNLIKSYVEKDPTAFYTYEEFELGVETLRQFCSLRSQSISMQLENGETTSDMSYADASDLNLSDMGSMNMRGGGMQNMGGKRSNFDNTGEREPNMHGIPDTSTESVLDAKGTSAATSGGMFQNLSNSMPSDIPEGFTGEMPEGFDPSQMPEGFDASQRPVDFNGDFPGQSSDRTETTPSTDSDSFNNTDSSKGSNRPSDGNIQMPSRDFSSMGAASSSSVGWIWITVSVLILGIGLIIAKKYKY